MTDIVERLRLFVPDCEDPNDYLEDELLFLNAADELERLREEIKAARDTIFLLRRSTLTSAELRLVDKNCDWEPFRHAFNAVMNHRLSCANKNAVFALGEKE